MSILIRNLNPSYKKPVNRFTMQLISIRIQELLRLIFAGKITNHLKIYAGHFGRIVKIREVQV